MREFIANFRWGLTGERQCMLVDDGRVVWRRFDPGDGRGTEADSTRDLGGRYLLPGFTDCHCHILPTGLGLQELDLGECDTRDAVLEALRERQSGLGPGDWLIGRNYDQNRFEDGGHLTRAQLDRLSAARPILVRHSNGHAGVANTGALSAASVQPELKIAGGEFGRDSHGGLNGLLLERAFEHVSAAVPGATLEQMVDAILAAGDLMASQGITCAAEMMTGYRDLDLELAAYRQASKRGCRVRLRLYLMWSRVLGPRALKRGLLSEHVTSMSADTCRVAGLKLFADGALSSRTAAIRGAYEGEAPAHKGIWSGTSAYRAGRLDKMLRKAESEGYRVATHSLGDYATDCVATALEGLEHPERHRLEHVMMLDDRQIKRIKALGVSCSQQPDFLPNFASAYRRSIGERRARTLNRTRSLLEAGVKVGFSSDRPVVAGDPWNGILAACSRPEGFDPRENLTRTQAIEAYTAFSADLCGDTGLLGRLQPGERADYQVYDDDPLTAARPRSAETHLG